MIVSRIGWYLYAQSMVMMAIMLAAGLGVAILVESIGVSRAHGGAGMGMVLLMAGLRSLSEIAPGLPLVALVGAAMAIHRLRRRNELAVIMQANRSTPVLLLPVLAAGMTLGLFQLIVLNYVGVEGRRLASELSTQAQPAQGGPRLDGRAIVARGTAEHHFLFIDRVDPARERIEGVTFVATDPEQNLLLWITASDGRWTGEGWAVLAPDVLFGVADSLSTSPDGGVILPGIARDTILARLHPPAETTLVALPRAIAFAESVGGPVARYRMQMASLLAMPFLLGTVAFLAGAIFIAPLPMRAWAGPVAGVMLAALGIFALVRIVEALGGAGLIAAPLAGTIAPLVCLAAGLSVLFTKGQRGRRLHRLRMAAMRQGQSA